jgi:hypothetical protein
MDDLTFRKTIFAEPFTTDTAVIKAAAQDPKKQAFWNDIKAMENDLKLAMDIPVPKNLAEKLILRQSLSEHKSTTQRRPWYLALAASVVFASVLTLTIFNNGNSKLVHDVLAHMSHVDAEMMKSATLSNSVINDRLTSFNGQVNGDLGEVVSANYCYLDKIKSLHLIIRGENGFTSLFVVPDSITESLSKRFNNANYEGASFLMNSAKIIVVGKNKTDVKKLEQRAKQIMSFTA